MKTNSKRFFSGRTILGTLVLAGILLIAGACNDDDNENNEIFKAVLNGTSEVPPNTSPAVGTATLTYNRDTRVFNVIVEYTTITPVSGHIHKGDVGVAGSVLFPFEGPLTSPINYTSPVLTEVQEAELYAGQYYVNLHTAQYQAGEIRGQLLKQ